MTVVVRVEDSPRSRNLLNLRGNSWQWGRAGLFFFLFAASGYLSYELIGINKPIHPS